MSYKVNTATYSGPFDLLLQLVSRQKVAIGSISISEVADQYLAEVDAMEELDLDVASDFVLVASTLLDMKAHALVPQDVSLKNDLLWSPITFFLGEPPAQQWVGGYKRVFANRILFLDR